MKLHRILALQLKQWYLSKRSFDRMSDLFIWPFLDLLLWGFFTLYLGDMTDAPVQAFLLGGLILWIFLWRANNDISLYVLEDFWSRNLYNLFSSPMTVGEFVISLTFGGILRIIVTFGLTALFALLFYHFNIFSMGILTLVLSGAVLMMFGWAVGLAISSLFFRYGDRVQMFSWGTTLLLQPFSCVFYPLAALPQWAQAIAKFLPSTHVFEGMRDALQSHAVPWQNLGIAFGETIFLLILSALLFNLAIRRAKKIGLLTKY